MLTSSADIDDMSKQLRLLGGFGVRCRSAEVALSPRQQRLLAFITLRARIPIARRYVAGTLWPLSSDERAGANLRSSLWRLHRAAPHFVGSNTHEVWLEPDVSIDVDHLTDTIGDSVDAAASELLPGWYDDWLVPERERLRQLLIHSIESKSRTLIDAHSFGEAIDWAWRALAAEPLRESAYALLIEAHLGEGNVLAAVEQYHAWAKLLKEEFNLTPTESLQQLIRDAATGTSSHFDLTDCTNRLSKLKERTRS